MTLTNIFRGILSELMDRSDMPQIDHSDLPEAFSILKDDGIRITSKTVEPAELKHSQFQVNKEKVKNIIKDMKAGKKMPPIVISSDNYIVDGHHRWLAYKSLKQSFKVVEIGLPRDKAIQAYKKVEEMI